MLCIYMCICTCIYMYVYIRMYIHMYIYIYMKINRCVYPEESALAPRTEVFLRCVAVASRCLCTRIHQLTCGYLAPVMTDPDLLRVYICKSICVYTCVKAYIYIYIYIKKEDEKETRKHEALRESK